MAPTTEKDLHLLAVAYSQCADVQPKIDYAKLAGACGYSTAASATTAFHRARKSFFANSETGGEASATPATPKTPKSGKKRSADAGDTPGDDTTGTKKKRPGRKSKAELPEAVAAAASAADQDDEDGLAAKAEVRTDSGNGDSVKAEKTSDTEE